MDMAAELIPRLHICEIAPSLACDHDLASRSRHLFKDNYLSLYAVLCKCLRRAGCSHKARRTRAYYYNVS